MRSLVTNAVNAGYGYLWVGLSDAGENGVWRFFCGQKYDPEDRIQPAAWYYHRGWRCDEDDKCAVVYDWGDSEGLAMNDHHCDDSVSYGLCEVITQAC